MNLYTPLAQQFLARFTPRKPRRSDFAECRDGHRVYHEALREWRTLRRAVSTQILQATEAELRALLS